MSSPPTSNLYQVRLLAFSALCLSVILREVRAHPGGGSSCVANSARVREGVQDLLQCASRHGSMIFPIDENTGNVDSRLLDAKEDQWSYVGGVGNQWPSGSYVGNYEGNHRRHQHHGQHRPYQRRRRYGRSVSQCQSNRVCTAVFSLQEDPDRIPRSLLVATCPNCPRCANLGATCTQTMYTMTVFRNCTTLEDSSYASCQAVQESVPVGCSCILDTLNK